MSTERPRPQAAPAFARAVLEAREQAGLDAAVVAARAGIEPSAYEAIERGEGTDQVDLESILRIADALGVSVAELFKRARL